MTKEEITRIAREVGFDDGEIETCQLMFEHFAFLVASAEREACARVCNAADKSTHPADLAEAIRARGQA
jgi:hypothetical protein